VFDCFVIIMFPGKGKFGLGYDLLHHSPYCIIHEIVIEASKKLKSSKEILSGIIPKLDFDL